MFVQQNDYVHSSDSYIFPRFKKALSRHEAIVCLLNAAIGAGILRLGSGFRCGIVLALIMAAVTCLLNYASFWFYSRAIASTSASSFVEIWSVCIGRSSIAIPVIASVSCSIIFSMWYISFIIKSIESILSNMSLSIIKQYLNHTSLVLGVYFIFVFPHCFNTQLKPIYYISFISLCCLALLLFHSIYWLYYEIDHNGFDPRNELKLFSFDKNALSCLNSFITAYAVYPLSWPGVRHYEEISYSNLITIFKKESVICFLLYSVFGTVAYFTFFEKNTGGLILSYYQSGFLRLSAEIVLIGMMALSLPLFINSSRYNLMEAIFPIKSFEVNNSIWVPLGIVSSFISAFLAISQGRAEIIINILGEVSPPLLVFVFPPILFLASDSHKTSLSKTSAWSFLMLGLLYLGFTLYNLLK